LESGALFRPIRNNRTGRLERAITAEGVYRLVRSFQIPIFGIYLHENDSWIVTGIFSLVAMMLLNEFMKRELENIMLAKGFVRNKGDKILIILAQIFASPKA
jgi:hypothetical protein